MPATAPLRHPKECRRRKCNNGEIPHATLRNSICIFEEKVLAKNIVGMNYIGLIQNISISETIGGRVVQLLNSEFSPLWFIKYLMVFVLISPLMYYILKNKIAGGMLIILSLLLNIIFYYNRVLDLPIDVNANNFSMFNYQYVYYAVGCYMALNYQDFVEMVTKKKCYIALSILVCLFIFYIVVIAIKDLGNAWISHEFRLIYIGALWFVYDLLPTIKIYSWMRSSFFLYCTHLIVLQCVQRVCQIVFKAFGIELSFFTVLEYAILPLIVITILKLPTPIRCVEP